MANKDVKMSYIEDDLKKIQVKPNLYIQKYGPLGDFHLAKEVVQNSVDELEDPNTNGSRIDITYDELDDRLTVEDDGRGIPEEDYKIDLACTKLQMGSKFYRTEGGKSSGEFGVGITVVNALSSMFSLATYRNTYMHEITFNEGKKVNDEDRPLKRGEKKHGTKTSFIVNPLYLGKDTHMPFDVLYSWLDLMRYQFASDISIHVTKNHGLEKLFSKTLKKKPFSEIIYSDQYKDSFSQKFVINPVTISGHEVLEEDVVVDLVKNKKKKLKKDVNLDVVFGYSDVYGGCMTSFCNFTQTDAGGVHEDAVNEVLLRFLQNKTKSYMSEKEKEKWDITWNDVKDSGLVVFINLSTNAQVDFMGNAKEKIQNEKLKPLIKKIMQDGLNELASKNDSMFQAIGKLVKSTARARIEAAKNRKASKVGKTDNLGRHEIDNYVPCNNKGKKYKEIFFIEGGKSASGSVVNGRVSADFQAVFGFRGVTKNPYKCTLADIMSNSEWKNMIRVLGCGIGNDFNLSRLQFDKIIIATDADIDGFYIAMGIMSFFVMYLPAVVEAGHLYKVYSPLYHIDDKSHPFVQNKAELTEIFMKKVVKNYSVTLSNGDKLSKDEFYEFLFDTVDYQEDLLNLRDYLKVNYHLIEMIAAILVESGVVRTVDDYDDLDKVFGNQKFITNMMNRIQKKYPEITVKNKFIRGIVDGRYCSVEVNKRFVKKIEPFIDIYQTYGSELLVEDKKNKKSEKMTISEFYDITTKLRAKILIRYKGLGEADPEEIGMTTLDPNNRLLVRLTMNDCEKALETFYKLQGNRKKDMEARKTMMENYTIDPEYLDN